MCPLIKKKQKSILFESEREKHSRQKKSFGKQRKISSPINQTILKISLSLTMANWSPMILRLWKLVTNNFKT